MQLKLQGPRFYDEEERKEYAEQNKEKIDKALEMDASGLPVDTHGLSAVTDLIAAQEVGGAESGVEGEDLFE